MPKRPPKHWFKRCVKAVKTRSKRVTNPNKICGNNWHNRMSAASRKKALREEKKILAKRRRRNMAEDDPVFMTYCEPGEGTGKRPGGVIDCETYQDRPVRILDRISDFMRKATGRTRARNKRRVVISVKVCKKIYLAKDKAMGAPCYELWHGRPGHERLEGRFYSMDKVNRRKKSLLALEKSIGIYGARFAIVDCTGTRTLRERNAARSLDRASKGKYRLVRFTKDNASKGSEATQAYEHGLVGSVYVSIYNSLGRPVGPGRYVTRSELSAIRKQSPVGTALQIIPGRKKKMIYAQKTSSGWHTIN